MSNIEELWQAYGLNGEPTQRALTKTEARTGILHGAAHVWIWRVGVDGAEVLLQRRAKDKATWPSHLDISAAGHIGFGEAPLAAALREAHEEVGLTLDSQQLNLLFVCRWRAAAGDAGIIENEFQWVYGCKLTKDTELRLDHEVDAVEWLTLADFQALIASERPEHPLVPHGDAYFANLLAELARLTGQ